MNFDRKTKIVAKIADNKSEVPFLKMVFDAGVELPWLNTAHQDEPEALELVKRIRSISTRLPIMIDTKGPEIRTKNVEKPIEVKAGDYLIFTGDLTYTGANVIQVTYPNFHNEVPVGMSVFYDDASIETVVEEKIPRGIKCVVKSSGLIKNKKSLNIPNVHIELPTLTDKDKRFIHFCAKNEIDFISHSFVRNKEDLMEIHKILKAYPDYKGKIISKIENREGFDNLEEILDHSEGIMVARGDLGAEVPLEELPFMQKKMVEAALRKGKYVIVATQVLDSMIKNPRPTRAEVSDTANAILDGTGAISMSGETAYGDYPREATAIMAKIMKYTEAKRDELIHFTTLPVAKDKVTKQAKSIVAKADKLKAAAIIVMSSSIALSKAMSKYRPGSVVIPVGLNDRDMRELTFAYAVRPIMASEVKDLPFTAKQTLLIVTEGKKGSYKIKKGTVKDLK